MTDEEVVDLVKSTQRDLGPMKPTNFATTLQHHEFWNRIMRQDNVKYDGGTAIEETPLINKSTATRHTNPMKKDIVNIEDGLSKISAPWRHTTSNYAIIRQHLLMNKGGKKIVDMVKTKRAMMMTGMAELMEEAAWGKPADSSDEETPWGVAMYIVYSAGGTGGFDGGLPSGFTTAPWGLNHARYKNWSDTYANVTKSDLIKKMRKAYRKINFKLPVDVEGLRSGVGQQFRIYVNDTTISEIEDVGEAQNENLGKDIASMDGQTVFRKAPIIHVPALDANANYTDPVLMLDMGSLYPVFLEGDFMRESDPIIPAYQHNIVITYVDNSWNIWCANRRGNAVLAKNA